MSSDTDSHRPLTALYDELAIVESDRKDADWVLRDTETGEEIPIWPQEVPEMVALLEAFEERMIGENTSCTTQQSQSRSRHSSAI